MVSGEVLAGTEKTSGGLWANAHKMAKQAMRSRVVADVPLAEHLGDPAQRRSGWPATPASDGFVPADFGVATAASE